MLLSSFGGQRDQCGKECGGIEPKYLAETIDTSNIAAGVFNLLVAGCGTGKSYFIMNNLRAAFPDVRPGEILVVTSRALTRDQQALNKNMRRYSRRMLVLWNGLDDDFSPLLDAGIHIGCYSDIIAALAQGTVEGHVPLEKLRIVVFDECHTLFSDEFIDDIKWLRTWITNALSSGDKIILGLTATPNIVRQNAKAGNWGAKIHQVNDEVVVRYRAKQMIATKFDTIPFLLRQPWWEGKTIIMCPSVRDCLRLRERVPQSTVVVSPYSQSYDPQTMDYVREYIKRYESLPYKVPVRQFNKIAEEELRVLICTSTAREGFNLRATSGVHNAISCFSDELHVTQFAGRCRYPLDNIVVADTYIRSDNFKGDDYLVQSRKHFREFLRDGSGPWFDTVSHLVAHDADKVRRFVTSGQMDLFEDWLRKKWLPPKDAGSRELRKYKIWREGDKQEIIDAAIRFGIVGGRTRERNFNNVMSKIAEIRGIEVRNGIIQVDGQRHAYRMLVAVRKNKSKENKK